MVRRVPRTIISGPSSADLRMETLHGRGLTWAVTITMFCVTTAHTLDRAVVPAPRVLVDGAREFPWAVPVTWCLIVVLLIAVRFWS